MDTKILHKLDSLLSMYYASSTTDGEKTNAKFLFEKICKKNNIDPNEYRKYSKVNPANSRQRNYGSRSNYKSTNNEKDFWDFIHKAAKEAREAQQREKAKRDEANEYRRRYAEQERKEKEYEQCKKEEFKKRWDSNKWGTLEFEMKEPLWEVKIHNQKRVILLNTMVRSWGTQNRWGTQNFCIYSDTFDPEQWFKNKESIYFIRSGKVQYFRDHYIMEKMWGIDINGVAFEIPLK